MGNFATAFHCLLFPTKMCRSRATTFDQSSTTDTDSGFVDTHDTQDGGLFDTFVSAIRNRILSNSYIAFGKSFYDLPRRELVPMTTEVLAADTGPEGGVQCLSVARKKEFNNFHCEARPVSERPIAGVADWTTKHHKAYGLSQSLYEVDPEKKILLGEPNADAFAVVARGNNAFMAVADGVNWGEKAFLAARSAVKGCIEYLSDHLHEASTTQDVVEIMLRSFKHAHSCIIDCQATLTTLCAAVVCKLRGIDSYGLCVVNVGDSLVYVYKKQNYVQEITVGSHNDERDMRNAGGCLGPSDGHNPDLTNLTFSFTFVDEGDIVFLTTDGISDNFDPVVLKKSKEDVNKLMTEPMKAWQSDEWLNSENTHNGTDEVSELKYEPERRRRSMSAPVDSKILSLSRQERQNFACKLMKQVIESNTPSGVESSATELCANLISFVIKATSEKRSFLENGDIDPKMRYRKSKTKPGKLDHATVAAYEVGHFHRKPLKLASRNQHYIPSATSCSISDETKQELGSLFGMMHAYK